MSNTEKNLLAFIGGAFIGAMAGLLLAPDSGKNTRDKLGKKINELNDDLEKLSHEGQNKYEEFKGKLSEELKNIEKKVKVN